VTPDEYVSRRLSRYLATQPRGAASQLASDLGLSRATVSRIKNGTYEGSSSLIERLGEEIDVREAAEKIAAGEMTLMWLVHIGSGNVRSFKTKPALDRFRAKHPDCHVMSVWYGNEPTDVRIIGTDHDCK
jgi:transcriptional regulator with XRE-family HTH domain